MPYRVNMAESMRTLPNTQRTAPNLIERASGQPTADCSGPPCSCNKRDEQSDSYLRELVVMGARRGRLHCAWGIDASARRATRIGNASGGLLVATESTQREATEATGRGGKQMGSKDEGDASATHDGWRERREEEVRVFACSRNSAGKVASSANVGWDACATCPGTSRRLKASRPPQLFAPTSLLLTPSSILVAMSLPQPVPPSWKARFLPVCVDCSTF